MIGTPLTIALGAIVAAFLLKDITLAEAGLIGAMLAPTDAGLGQAIVNNAKVPAKIRQALNVESGLNDGGAIPFFLFFLILAGGEALEQPVGNPDCPGV
ncbi:Na+/H+ antiporter [Methanosarcina horonobensis HB-1 = JCM 15518]|uniref:Na+/H+ antiporter n=1 Tax=Methanosarcina horonobensis HB-1 = JCM 15518 TaxID=1434110 RepID=A0A0E3SFA1_9EURY|nr:Na+/H+ antiporter [Methanosarcina horonobensis HB-1 = JCM 15518]